MSFASSHASAARNPRWPSLIETLEARQLLSLLGVALGDTYVETEPTLNTVSYDAASRTLEVRLQPVGLKTPNGWGPIINADDGRPYEVRFRVEVGDNGRLIGGVAGADLTMVGAVIASEGMFDGDVLAGEVAPYAFGFDEQSPKLDLVFDVASSADPDSFTSVFFGGKQIGVTLELGSAVGQLPGSFMQSFSVSNVVAMLGPIDPMVIPPPQEPQVPQPPDPEAPQPQGTPIHAGQTASVGFWRGKQGQKLLKSVNPGLGNWLAGSHPNLFGMLAGKSNAQVADLYRGKFAKWLGLRPTAKLLAAAFAVYVTRHDLGGPAAAQSGFEVSAQGTGAAMINVGRSGAAFGVANDAMISVNNALAAADQAFGSSVNHRTRRIMREVFSRILEQGQVR